MYHTIIPAVHLIIMQENQILLLQRQNTNYHDGDYSIPAGHIEKNESVFQAAIREGSEELGIVLDREDLEILQVMHRKSSEERVDFFSSSSPL